jgi:hypothetical protein
LLEVILFRMLLTPYHFFLQMSAVCVSCHMKLSVVLCAIFLNPWQIACAQSDGASVLSVITLPGYLGPGIVKEFESQFKVQVRVEFVLSEQEAEARFRLNGKAYDVAILSESSLLKFAMSKRFLSIDKLALSFVAEKESLLRQVSTIEDGKSWGVLAGNPLGWSFLSSSEEVSLQENSALQSWNVSQIVAKNSNWRGRVCIPDLKLFQFLLFALYDSAKESKYVTDWLLGVSQKVGTLKQNLDFSAHSKCKHRNLVLEQLSGKVGPAAQWLSEFLKARDLDRKYKFVVPQNSGLIERVGVAASLETSNQKLAVNFVTFLLEKREKLALETGLLSLQSPSTKVKYWNILSEILPLSAQSESILMQIK